MSWWGGGEISPTPGVEYRVFAIHGYTLWPGSWPPSPGLAPWAILICRSSALTRYSEVTPKRPEATCLMALRRESPLSSGLQRSGSSPPSPVLEGVPLGHLGGQHVETDAAEAGDGAGEVAVDDLLGETDGFEHLGAGVGRGRRDAHLRHDLEDALAAGLDVALDRLAVRDARDDAL